VNHGFMTSRLQKHVIIKIIVLPPGNQK